MGTWGPAIFSNDLASDIKDDFKYKIAFDKSSELATKELIEEYRDSINDPDESTVFWLALASIQWDLGRVTDLVNKTALKILSTEADLQKWKNSKDYFKREKALSLLQRKLLSTPPPPKRVKKPYVQKTPFKKGELLSYQLSNGKFCIIKIVDIEEQHQGDTYPLIELIDYYSQLNPRDIINHETLQLKNLEENFDDGFLKIKATQQAYIISTGPRDIAPMKRINILKKDIQAEAINGFIKTFFWKTFEEDVIEIFE